MTSEDLTISLNEVTGGAKVFDWRVGLEFFQSFENENILGADVEVKVSISKVEGSFLVDVALNGTLTVPCDRCGEAVELPCRTKASLIAMHQEEDSDIWEKDGREIIPLPTDASALDLSQDIYDFAILSLPMKCAHKKGQCSAEALAALKGSNSASKEQENKPFAALADLMRNSNN